MTKEYIREAYHAGSWYQNNPHHLHQTLQSFLNEATTTTSSETKKNGLPRGIIAPHAGYRYSGPTAGYAYIHLRDAMEKGWEGTVVVLHPSHHVYLDGCAVSGASVIQTPVGDINVDKSLRSELLQNKTVFSTMTKKMDEEEHSGEMQYPFIAHIYNQCTSNSSSSSSDNHDRKKQVQILPIMVGSTSESNHYGQILAPILSRPNIFTVISTDFCHWGSRFGYSPTNSSDTSQTFTQIYKFIEWLDHLGMEQISLQDPGAFAMYIKNYKNTICGRYPITVYLHALQEAKTVKEAKVSLEFVKYAQSSQVTSMDESSVSYASAVVREIS